VVDHDLRSGAAGRNTRSFSTVEKTTKFVAGGLDSPRGVNFRRRFVPTAIEGSQACPLKLVVAKTVWKTPSTLAMGVGPCFLD